MSHSLFLSVDASLFDPVPFEDTLAITACASFKSVLDAYGICTLNASCLSRSAHHLKVFVSLFALHFSTLDANKFIFSKYQFLINGYLQFSGKAKCLNYTCLNMLLNP